MFVEIINTGTELMLGCLLNSHQQWLCRQLSGMGYTVSRQTAIPDRARDIESAVREALARTDLVITTGGLGPTSDDLTREAIARLLNRELVEDAAVLAHIQTFFAERQRSMPETTRVQAMVPRGAWVLPNRHGTAPGLFIELNPNPFRHDSTRGALILLPGPTRELRPMFLDELAPLLRRSIPPNSTWFSRTLRVMGLGESVVEEKIAGPLSKLVKAGLEIGYSARPGLVEVRLIAQGNRGKARVEQAATIVCSLLDAAVFGTGDEELEQTLIRLLTQRNATVAVAESCTGGCIAHWLTNVPGASAVFRAGWITYSNEAKAKFLGVRAETLERFGAVSEAVAREMAEGARRLSGADYAIAVTGIAGPTGATPTKPVGTVFIALASPQGTHARQMLNVWDRQTFKEVTTRQALNELRLLLENRAVPLHSQVPSP